MATSIPRTLLPRLILILPLVMSIVSPASIFAEEDTTITYTGNDGKTIYFDKLSNQTLDNSHLTTKNCTENKLLEGEITIPASFIKEGITYTVEEIGQQSFQAGKLSKITIPEGVTKIGWLAFSNCFSLTEVKLPSTLETIAGEAFKDCKALKKVDFSTDSNLTSIGNDCFISCSALTAIDIPSSVNTIYQNAFKGSGLKTLNLNNVKTIQFSAFENCTSLKTVNIKYSGSEQMTMGKDCFKGCTALESADFSDMNTIPQSCFSGCTMLSDIKLSNNLSIINASAFSNCESLKTIDLPNSLTLIGASAFAVSGITSIIIPDNMTSVGNKGGAFVKCSSLESITLPLNLDEAGLGMGYFTGSTNIKDIKYLADQPIAYNEYYEGTKYPAFESVVYENAILHLSQKGYNYVKQNTDSPWNQFKNIVGPDDTQISLEGLPTTVFCKGTKNLTATCTTTEDAWRRGIVEWSSSNPSVISIESNSDNNVSCKIKALLQSGTATITATYKDEFGNKVSSATLDITISKDFEYTYKNQTLKYTMSRWIGDDYIINAYVNTADGSGADASKRANNVTGEVSIPDQFFIDDVCVQVTGIGKWSFGANVSKVTIPSNVTSIQQEAFGASNIDNYVSNLQAVMFSGNSLTTIGEAAFSNCSKLTSITLPSEVNSIGSNAFKNCTELATITIPSNVSKINSFTFMGCTKLSSITFAGNNVTTFDQKAFSNTGFTEFSIPNTVTTIYSNAFLGCTKLQKLTIPGSVTSLGNNAFDGCTALTEVIYDIETIKELSGQNIFSSTTYSTAILKLINIKASAQSKTKAPWMNFVNISPALPTAVELSRSSATLLRDAEKLQLIASLKDASGNDFVFPNDADDSVKGVTWISSDTNIATVSAEGIVTPVREGKCTITASSKLLNSLTSSCEITITCDFVSDCLTFTILQDGIVETKSGTLTGPASEAGNRCSGDLTIPSEVVYTNSDTDYIIDESKTKFTVTKIGEGSFYMNTDLSSVTIPSSVTSIGDSAFSGATGITAVTYLTDAFPANVNNNIFSEEIYQNAVLTVKDGKKGEALQHEPWSLFKTILPDDETFTAEGIIYEVIKDEDGRPTNDCKMIGVDPDYDFADGKIAIPSQATHTYVENETNSEINPTYNVVAIDAGAFGGDDIIQYISLPGSIPNLPDGLLAGLDGLTDFEYLNENITDQTAGDLFGDSDDAKYDTVTLHVADGQLNHIIDIEPWSRFNQIEEPSDVIKIGDLVFNIYPEANPPYAEVASQNGNANIPAHLTIPEVITRQGVEYPVTKIADSAFISCYNLTKVTIPESITEIGEYAFYGCQNMPSIEIPQGVTEIKQGTFFGCYLMEEVKIPDGVTEIGGSAFYGCVNLNSLNIPESVKIIGDYAFNGAESITKIELPSSIEQLGDNAFSGCKAIEEIIYDTNHPVAGNADMFDDDVYGNCTLYFPIGAEDTFASTLPWSKFANRTPTYLPFVTDIEVDEENLSVLKYNKLVIEPTMSPDGAVDTPFTLQIADPKIATIDEDGAIVGIESGTTTVTVTSADAKAFAKSFALTVRPLRLGDSNANDKITVADAVNTLNHIMERETPIFDFEASDVNSDQAITIADASGIISLAMAETYETETDGTDSPASAPASFDTFVISDASFSGGVAVVDITLTSAGSLVALQTDINVSEGVEIENIEVGPSATGHSASVSHIDERTIRVALYSLRNIPFARDGIVMRLILRGDDGISGEITAMNTIVADADANESKLPLSFGIISSESGISVSSTSDTQIYSSEGFIHLTNIQGLPYAVYTVDGTLMSIGKAATEIVSVPVTPGIFIIKTNNRITKIIAR